MKILYLHGRGEQPGGLKPALLQSNGYEVINPYLGEGNFQRSFRIAQQAYDEEKPDLIVAISRGAGVAINIQTEETPLILIAPLWKKIAEEADGQTKVKSQVTILHSESDDLIPLTDSQELLENSGLDESHLIVIGLNHYMNDVMAHEMLLSAVGKYETEA